MNNELTIIGVGSLGKNFLNSIIKKKVFDKINIFDNDNVHKHNIVYDASQIGKSKVQACYEQYGDYINPIQKFIYDSDISQSEKEIFKKSKYIIDCRDIFENRKNFSAIKLYINNNKMIVDFRKKIAFKNAFNSEYVAYINNSKIKMLTNQFSNFLINKKEVVDNLINNNKTMTISTLGEIEYLDLSSKYIYSKKIIREISDISKKYKIQNLQIDIEDGIYNIFNNVYNIKNINLPCVLQEIENNCEHFSSYFLKFYIQDKNLLVKIMNQTGGA